jgi:hypothetical protein
MVSVRPGTRTTSVSEWTPSTIRLAHTRGTDDDGIPEDVV